MPEVRLAWRAALCHGSPSSQVFVGVAPGGEMSVVCRTLPRSSVRCYDLPSAGGGVGPVRGLAASANTFGVLPLARQARGKTDDLWDLVLTVALREDGALPALASEMGRAGGAEEHCFVAALAMAPAAEQALFEALGDEGPPSGLAELKERVGSLCSRLAANG